MKHQSSIVTFVFLSLLTCSVLIAEINLQNVVAQTQTPTPLLDDEWSMFHHDLNRTGTSISKTSNGNLLWRFSTGPSTTPSMADQLRASPTVVNDVVYIGSNKSIFYALNATTGSTIWQVNMSSVVESSAAVVNNVVYIGLLWDGYNGYIEALNASSGSVIWRFATNSGIESSPAVINGVVYIGSFSGYVYALNAADGTLIWSYLTGGTTFSSPAIVEGVLYIGSGDGHVYALNIDNGALLWKSNVGNQVYASPAVIDGKVYVGSDDGHVCALRAIDGSLIWQANIGVGDHSDDSPAVANGIVYFGSRNGYYAFNATDGSQIWFFTSPYSSRQFTGYVYSSPAVAGDIVYFGSCDGYLFALNAYDGSIIWSYCTGIFMFSSHAIVDGVVYVGSYDGYVYAIGTSGSIPTQTPHPTIQLTAAHSPASTGTPIINPAPLPTPNPTEHPTFITFHLTPAPTQNQLPPLLYISQPTAGPVGSADPNTSGNLLILGTIIIAALSVTFFVQICRSPHGTC
jgi:outer membrane protein assembly factor BamB